MKSHKISVFFLILFLTWANETFSNDSPVIIINDKISSFEISPKDVEIFEDSINSFDFNDILKLPDSKFMKNHPLYTKNSKGTYWVKFTVASQFQNKKKWVIEILDSRHYDVELYLPEETGKYYSIVSGLKRPFYTRNYQHKNFVMDIDLKPNTISTFYLKFEPHLVGSLLFKIRANDEFSSYAFNEYYFLGTYYGIIFIIALLNIILFLFLKEWLYLIYSVYIIAWGWNSMLDDGVGYQFIWSNVPPISQLGFIIGKPLLLLLFVFYSKLFLNIKGSFPKYNKRINFSVGMYIVLFVVNQFVYYPSYLYFFIFLIPLFVIYYVSIKVHQKGFKPARFFIIGNTFIILGFIIRMVKDLDVFPLIKPWSIIAIYSQNGGIVLEICTLFIALGDRFRFLKVQKEKVQGKVIEQLKKNKILSQKVNQELEEKVTERTTELLTKSNELEDLNEKLERQAQEISKWNQLLDIDNYKLKQKVKEVNEARIKSENMSYEEFLQVFPDEISCMRYIDEIKWKNGYQCKKCGNNKYSQGPKIFSRRCSKCGYNESVTAHTFLYRCKFSLVKAFYMMMKLNKYGDEINCAELSRELDMRKSTVWEFKNRVMECKEGKQKDLDFLLLNNLK